MTAKAIVRAAALAGTLLLPAVVHADLAACIGASEQGISLRRSGHLREARIQLAACSAPSCPDEVRADCGKRMEALNAAMPGLVVGAKDVSGNDVTKADVAVDGIVVANVLDGRPIELDPGEHLVRVTAAGLPSAERKLVVGEGEKNRHEGFVLGTPVVVVAPPVSEPSPPRRSKTRQTVGIVGGSLGLAGIGVGAVFGALASSKWSSSKSETTAQASCSSAAQCPAHASAVSDHDTAVTYATISTVGFGVGGALLVAGVVTFLTAPRTTTSSTPSAWLHVVPMFERGGGSLGLVGAF